MIEVVALSGGKDSVAMALRLKETEPRRNRQYLYTPTGDELPPMKDHMDRVKKLLGVDLVIPEGPTLRELIDEQQAIPNWRMRWCTRMIKIEPCIEYMKSLRNPVLCVGLRADEEWRGGLYDEHVTNRFPLQEWGWGLKEVLDYLEHRGVEIPERTDCARCYYQRLIEWHNLWKEYPDIYQSAVEDEIMTGHTYRSPTKDKWPASLTQLREMFRAGWVPKHRKRKGEDRGGCRVCLM